ncbi:MAG: T9SS C-terminal target domain-containing protein [Bacteroidetes bacterium]|nr:MAG: T9SS C-terminal target domain-containing protein [Bacteroidota bacterium]
MLKLSPAGDFLWASAFGGFSIDEAYAIAIDGAGAVYTTGGFRGSVDFDPGAGAALLTAAGSYDIFVQKMSDATTAMDEADFGLPLVVYPNPSRGLIEIAFARPLHKVTIDLMDGQGKVLATQPFDVVTHVPWSFEGPAGLYFLRITTPQGQRVVKLIKE